VKQESKYLVSCGEEGMREEKVSLAFGEVNSELKQFKILRYKKKLAPLEIELSQIQNLTIGSFFSQTSSPHYGYKLNIHYETGRIISVLTSDFRKFMNLFSLLNRSGEI
jgi:hypothetical protein